MPSVETLLAVAAATAVFALFPGPALLYTAAHIGARGLRMFSTADVVTTTIASTVVSRLWGDGGIGGTVGRLGGSILVGLGAHPALDRS